MSAAIIDLDKIEHLKALLATISGLGDNAVTVIIVAAIIYFMIESVGYIVGIGFIFVLYKVVDKGSTLLKEHIKSEQVKDKSSKLLLDLLHLSGLSDSDLLYTFHIDGMQRYLTKLVKADQDK